jgi:PAS domain S-box-containing protein
MDTTADLVPFEALLNSTNEGLYGIDLEGRCTFLNRAGAEMLGFSRYEVLGRNMHLLIHHSHEDRSPYPEPDCPITRSIREGEAVRVESDVLWRKDGTSFAAEYSSSPIRDRGLVRGAVVTFVDITARKQQERRILVQHDVSRVMAEAASLPDAMPKILQAIGENLGWQVGVLWAVNRLRAVLRPMAIWNAASLDIGEFETVTREMTLPRGAGLAGRVWLEGKPQCGSAGVVGQVGRLRRFRTAPQIPARRSRRYARVPRPQQSPRDRCRRILLARRSRTR